MNYLKMADRVWKVRNAGNYRYQEYRVPKKEESMQ
jgi:hypothetical protein